MIFRSRGIDFFLPSFWKKQSYGVWSHHSRCHYHYQHYLFHSDCRSHHLYHHQIIFRQLAIYDFKMMSSSSITILLLRIIIFMIHLFNLGHTLTVVWSGRVRTGRGTRDWNGSQLSTLSACLTLVLLCTALLPAAVCRASFIVSVKISIIIMIMRFFQITIISIIIMIIIIVIICQLWLKCVSVGFGLPSFPKPPRAVQARPCKAATQSNKIPPRIFCNLHRQGRIYNLKMHSVGMIILFAVVAYTNGKELGLNHISAVNNSQVVWSLKHTPLDNTTLCSHRSLRLPCMYRLPSLPLTHSSIQARKPSSWPLKAARGEGGFAAFLGSLLPLDSGSGGGAQGRRQEAKETLFKAIQGLNRGVDATAEQKAAVDKAAKALECLNPNPKSLSADEVNGEWELKYTTSGSILGTGKLPLFRPWGPIYQTIDAGSLRARNRETWPFFNAVEAELNPTNRSNVKVQFKLFRIFGFIPVPAPASATGELDVTYVDSDTRVSRGDKGNLFVLVMSNPDQRLPEPTASFARICHDIVSMPILVLIPSQAQWN